MAIILVSLQSTQSRIGGLGILDPETGLRYLQIDTPSPLVRNAQPRGVVGIKDRIYVNTSASIRIYRLDDRRNGPLLKLEKEVILNEWLLGSQMQANMVPMIASEEKNRLYIGNNNFCSIDEIDLKGSLIRRQHLWEIAPEIFPLPDHEEPAFMYGFIRNLSLSPDGALCVTVADCNKKGEGKVISVQTGEVLVAGLNDPCDGQFAGELFYLNDIDQGKYQENKYSGKLSAYTVIQDQGTVIGRIRWAARPVITDEKWKDSIQNLRGMAITKGTVFCGVSHFGKTAGPQVPPRIVAFDAASGTQKREYLLPDLNIFRHPRVFFMTPLDEKFTVQWKEDLHFYFQEQHSTPEYYREEKREEAEKVQFSDASDKANNVSPAVISSAAIVVKPGNSLKEKEEEKGSSSIEFIGISGGTFPSTGQTVRQFSPSTEKIPARNIHFPAGQRLDNDEKNQWIQKLPEEGEEKIPSIILERVSLNYRRAASFAFLSKRKRHLGKAANFLAIDDVSFTIYEDETVGIIGRNGSGKSTISMIICGALPPDEGTVKVNGKVLLLALGVGFRRELTGRDNVFISGTLLGMSRREVAEKIEDIEEFAELGNFFDEPLRIYSSGMRSRLGFAVATAVNPEILILDEVMSTGDAAFRNKADRRMQEMRQRTKTVLMVSHNSEQLKNFCSRVVWLEKGRLIMDGPAVPILVEYNKFCKNPEKWLKKYPHI